jgi:arginine exporter protein ArgO
MGAPAGALMLPGALLAAVIFPQGVEGDHALVFMALAGFLDLALFALLIVVARSMLRRSLTRASS